MLHEKLSINMAMISLPLALFSWVRYQLVHMFFLSFFFGFCLNLNLPVNDTNTQAPNLSIEDGNSFKLKGLQLLGAHFYALVPGLIGTQLAFSLNWPPHQRTKKKVHLVEQLKLFNAEALNQGVRKTVLIDTMFDSHQVHNETLHPLHDQHAMHPDGHHRSKLFQLERILASLYPQLFIYLFPQLLPKANFNPVWCNSHDSHFCQVQMGPHNQSKPSVVVMHWNSPQIETHCTYITLDWILNLHSLKKTV